MGIEYKQREERKELSTVEFQNLSTSIISRKVGGKSAYVEATFEVALMNQYTKHW